MLNGAVTNEPIGATGPQPACAPLNRNSAGGETPYREVFYPIGFGVEILTNDREVLDAAAEIWGGLRGRASAPAVQLRIVISETSSMECPPAPRYGAERHLITFVADSENYATCDLNAGFCFASISRNALRERLYFRYHFLESLAMVLLSGGPAPALHAACVTRYERGMLFHGMSGAGKSSLAYACARAGFVYTSDDASYLLSDAGHARVAGFSHKMRFRPNCRELFPELGDYEITPRSNGKPSIEIPTADLRGIITAQEARIHYLILLKREAHAKAMLVPLPIDEALERLHGGLFPVEEVRCRHIAALDQLQSVEAFEFHYSNLSEAVACLDALALSTGQIP